MIVYQICSEKRNGDFIIFDEYPTLELAVARGMQMKIDGKKDLSIFVLDTENDFDEEILNIYIL
jgi:hypothetical protein